MIGIYKITSPTGRVYIGQSVNIEKRFRHYRSKNESTKQRRLKLSFDKYGIENHKFEVVEECSVDQLNDRERYWQDYYNVLDQKKGLNCVLTKSKDKSGYTSKETLNILSACQSGSNNGMYGKKHSEETKEKIRKKAIGRKASEETRKKLSLARSKRVITKETREKISISNSGKNHHMYGKNHTNESKSKISESLRDINKVKMRKIIDEKTLKIYDNIHVVSELFSINIGTLRSWLNGNRKNKTNFRYL